MIALIQRVTSASVMVGGDQIAKINNGLLVLLGVEKNDSEITASKLQKRVCGYRVFSDADGKMNVNLADKGGQLLIVPQFTLAASTNKGMRPSFSSAAVPAEGQRLFRLFVDLARTAIKTVKTGEFAADMQVQLINDGPVTFWLQVPPQECSS